MLWSKRNRLRSRRTIWPYAFPVDRTEVIEKHGTAVPGVSCLLKEFMLLEGRLIRGRWLFLTSSVKGMKGFKVKLRMLNAMCGPIVPFWQAGPRACSRCPCDVTNVMHVLLQFIFYRFTLFSGMNTMIKYEGKQWYHRLKGTEDKVGERQCLRLIYWIWWIVWE